MAKSLRSKRKRKLRAIKRERYGKKELAQLKKILGIKEDGDIDMENVSDVATVTDAKTIKENKMDIDLAKSDHSSRTFKNKHGNYPAWMSSREVKKRAIANRLKKQKQKRKRKGIKDGSERKTKRITTAETLKMLM